MLTISSTQIVGDILLQAEIRTLGGEIGIYLLHHGCYISTLHAGGLVDREMDRKRQGMSKAAIFISSYPRIGMIPRFFIHALTRCP